MRPMKASTLVIMLLVLTGINQAQNFGQTKADCQAQALIYQTATVNLPSDGNTDIFVGVYVWKSQGSANYNGTVVNFIETGTGVADGQGHFCIWSHAVLLNQNAGQHGISWDLHSSWTYSLSGFSGQADAQPISSKTDHGILNCNANGSHCHLTIALQPDTPNWIWSAEFTRE